MKFGLNRIDSLAIPDEAALIDAENELRALVERGFRFLRFPPRIERLFSDHDTRGAANDI
jgi:hypothetical protein